MAGPDGGINSIRLKSLVKSLIDIYSPSGKEKEISDFLTEYLGRYQLPVVNHQLEENRYNVYVLPSVRSDTVFLGHVDTVPAFDFAEYEARQKGDRISGLGAADMKAGCAAMIEAFITFHEKHGILPPAALALVVDEEENGDGTRLMLEKYSYKRAVVAEPTDLKICSGHYGYLELKLVLRGRRCHASMAGQEHNAIFAILKILMNLTGYLDEEWKEVTYNIRDVHSSDAGFAVPDKCQASLDLHVPPNITLARVKKDIRRVLRPWLSREKGQMQFSMVSPGYRLSEKNSLVILLKRIYERYKLDFEAEFFRSHSDASLLRAARIAPIILGPGQLALAHSNNEAVSFSQTVMAGRVYLSLLEKIAAGKKLLR